MYISLQNPRRLNHLRLPLQLLHIPIRTHIPPLEEPRLLAREPQDEMRGQLHCTNNLSLSPIKHEQTEDLIYHCLKSPDQVFYDHPWI